MRPSSWAIVGATVFLVACGGRGGIKGDGAAGSGAAGTTGAAGNDGGAWDGDAGDAPLVFSCADAGGGACNDNPIVSSIWGVCGADGRCQCSAGFALNPATGKCRPAPVTE